MNGDCCAEVKDNLTHLYILVFPEKEVIKIGKADEIHTRIQSLRRWWGEVDYEASYYLSIPTEIVFSLEKSLHFLLGKYSVAFDEGDGRTELFSYRALEIALKHIELFCASGAVGGALKKGVLLPPQRVITLFRKQEKWVRYQKKAAEFMTDINKVTAQFDRINRLLVILMRKQAKLAFQYDIVDDQIYFRLRISEEISRNALNSKMEKIMMLFSFFIHDFNNGWGMVNCCSASYSDGILQFNVCPMPSSNSLVIYFLRQSEFLLKKLPKRSAAATEAIPIIEVGVLRLRSAGDGTILNRKAVCKRNKSGVPCFPRSSLLI